MWIRQHKQSMSPAPTLEKFPWIHRPSLTILLTAIGTIAGKPNITETTVSFDVSLSQYVKTNTGDPSR